MASTLRIKRRTSGASGAPSSLKNAELAYNEVDDTLYYGNGDDGSGNATTVKAIAGKGAYVDLSSNQSVGGTKTFSSSPVVPTPSAGDNSTKVATTAFVAAAVGNAGGSQTANTVYAGPSSGSAASPTFRALVADDIPSLTASKITDFSSSVSSGITAVKGVANGICDLDSAGLVPSTRLPSYVDDVLEYANLAAFPATGSSGIIYIAADTGKSYRWTGSVYAEIIASPGTTDAITEGSTNLFFTTARVLATVLASLSTATNAAITASDTVLSAFGKVQAQVTARLIASNNLSDLTSASTARTNLGLGTIATQNANNVSISGGSIDGVSLDGGTF